MVESGGACASEGNNQCPNSFACCGDSDDYPAYCDPSMSSMTGRN
jgi:hypothetical protein